MGNKDIILRQPHLYMVLVVVIIIISAGLFFAFSKGPVNTDPEATMRAQIDYVNDLKGTAAVEISIYKFASPPEYDYYRNLFLSYGEYYQLELNMLTVFTESDMAPDYKREAQNVTEEYEAKYNIVIQEFCYINYSRTYNYYTGESVHQAFRNMGCAKVDDLWYICSYDYYGE